MRLLPALPRALGAAALQSQAALSELSQPWALTSHVGASLFSSEEEIAGCWGGFCGVCVDSQALDCCLSVPTWERPRFPPRLWKGKLVSITTLVGGMRGAWDELGFGEDQEGWVWVVLGGRCWMASGQSVGPCRKLVVLCPLAQGCSCLHRYWDTALRWHRAAQCQLCPTTWIPETGMWLRAPASARCLGAQGWADGSVRSAAIVVPVAEQPGMGM